MIWPPSAAVELPMSKKSALTPATAPASSAASLNGPPAATLPAHSESDFTAALDRSAVRIWWSYQPVASTVLRCRSVIPGPTGSVLSISASSSAACAVDGISEREYQRAPQRAWKSSEHQRAIQADRSLQFVTRR